MKGGSLMKAVIFDLDGVLCSTDRFHYQAWKSVADELGIYLDEQINNRLRGVSRMASLDIVLERCDREVPQEEKLELAERKNGRYRELLKNLTPDDLLPGVMETLEGLRRAGFKLAIGSSSKNTPFILERLGITDRFDAISDGNNITHSKPDPEVFVKAAEMLGLPCGDCLVVEDAVAGAEAAHRAGMKAACVGDAAEAGAGDWNLKSLRELFEVVGAKRRPRLAEKPFSLTRDQILQIEKTVKSLSLREKVGQLFCIMGQDYSEAERLSLVEDYAVGGILFRPAPTETIRQWYEPLDAAAKIPLLKAANLEEGGSGGASDATFFGWPMAVAASGCDSDMIRFAEVCAREGSQCGINWTFSPVCDIDMNFRNPITNVRTCGSDKERVKKLCSLYVKKLQSLGLAACAKHFPGDGVDYRDQHLHPTYNSLSADDWFASYGEVYRKLIDDGLMSVMVGHILQPAVEMRLCPEHRFEDCLPASVNYVLLTDLLRGELGFNGLITTDATIMAGFTQAMERRRAIPTAIAAGCDMLVFSTDIYEDMQYVLDGVRDGLLSEERLDEAVTRILALKACVCGKGRLTAPADAQKWRDECAMRSVTLVKSKAGVLPLSPKKYPHIRLFTLGNDTGMTDAVEAILKGEGFSTERFDIEKEELHGTASLGGTLNLYLANLEHASNQTAVRIFWAKKHALDAPRHVCEEESVFVSFANPYLLQDVPRVKTYINAYSCNDSTIRAVMDKLLGRSEFHGVSPVDPFCGLPDTRL